MALLTYALTSLRVRSPAARPSGLRDDPGAVAAQFAARDGAEVSMKDFVRAGLPVTAVTLVASTALLAILPL